MIKQTDTNWEKVFAKNLGGKILALRIHKQLSKLYKKTNNPIH